MKAPHAIHTRSPDAGETLFSVRDQVVVITGGLGRIGRRFARRLLAHGARVIVLDVVELDERERRSFVAGDADPEHLLCLNGNVTDRPSLEAALTAVESRWGTPHALVNCAAVDAPPDESTRYNGPFEDVTLESWERVLGVNTTGVFIACQVFGGAMAREGRGSIVNVASIYALVSPDQRLYEHRRSRGEAFFKPAAYSASKSALLALTRYLATYWSASGVRVNTLTLGGVFDAQDPGFVDAYCNRVPMGRMADPGEYDGALVFLLSNAASYMTGANFVLDGGFTAW